MGDQRTTPFKPSKIEFGKECRVIKGRKRNSNKGSFSSHADIHNVMFSNFNNTIQGAIQSTLQILVGGLKQMKGKFTGLTGKSCVGQKQLEEWDFEIYKSLIWRCWQSKAGGWYVIQTPWWLEY